LLSEANGDGATADLSRKQKTEKERTRRRRKKINHITTTEINIERGCD
jgi:hypothetical protein